MEPDELAYKQNAHFRSPPCVQGPPIQYLFTINRWSSTTFGVARGLKKSLNHNKVNAAIKLGKSAIGGLTKSHYGSKKQGLGVNGKPARSPQNQAASARIGPDNGN